MKILAVDYGDSRTGLATCDRTEFLTTAITPQITLKARDKVASKVCEVAKDIGAELIVIGLPLNMDGTEGERARKSRKLAKTLERPARAHVGRAPDHLRRRRPPRRERHLRRKAEGHPRLGERDGHSGRLSRMAEGASGGGLKAPRRPCGKVSLRSPDSLLRSPQKIVVFRFVFTIFPRRICIVFQLDSTGSSPIK